MAEVNESLVSPTMAKEHEERPNIAEDDNTKNSDHNNSGITRGSPTIEPNLEKQLEQMERDEEEHLAANNLAVISNNFKKRRLSKNEMDFLESELNLDMESITDADFDIHIQKLMNDNNPEPEKLESIKETEEKEAIEVENVENESKTNENPEQEKEKEGQVEKETENEPSQKEEENQAQMQEQEIMKPTDVDNRDNAESLESEKEQDHQNTEQTESVIPEQKSQQKGKISINTTTTDTYKGLSIPANSELFNSNETDSVLKAYRELLDGSDKSNIRESQHVNAQLSALPLLITAPDHLSFNVQMLINTLPVLDNLATQILRIIAKGPYQKVMELVSNRESYTGIAFGNLVELFETTKRVYNSEENPFFTVENVTFGLWKYGQQAPSFLRGREDTIEGTLRKVNLSTFLLATLGLIDLGFFFLNEAFLDVFCPPQNLEPTASLSFVKDNTILDGWERENKNFKVQRNKTKFLKAQAILYLELKTQAYISAIELGDRSKEDIIHDLFPDNMDEILLRRKDPYFESTGIKIERNTALFLPAELDFLSRCDFRKQTLLDAKADSSLMEKYEWIKFLNDLLEYVSKNVGFLIWGPKGKLSSELERLSNMKPTNEFNLGNNINTSKISKTATTKINLKEISKKRNIDEVNGAPPTQSISKSSSGKETSDTITTSTNKLSVASSSSGTKKAKTVKRPKANRPSTFRRIWTAEEEATLKKGLMEKGTHWTAILELYGPGGTVNENLKNRSSLQLKDKARNWRLYYVKNKLPIPSYLQKDDSDKTKGLISGVSSSAINKDEPIAISKSDYNPSENDVYSDMLNSLIPGDMKDDEKITSGEHEEAVASELKDLVAEAFK